MTERLGCTSKVIKAIKLKGGTYEIELMEKGFPEGYLKCYNFTMTNQFNANDFYIIQIIQAKNRDPEFKVAYFNVKDCFGNPYCMWDDIDRYYNSDDAKKLKALLIELSDKDLRGS